MKKKLIFVCIVAVLFVLCVGCIEKEINKVAKGNNEGIANSENENINNRENHNAESDVETIKNDENPLHSKVQEIKSADKKLIAENEYTMIRKVNEDLPQYEFNFSYHPYDDSDEHYQEVFEWLNHYVDVEISQLDGEVIDSLRIHDVGRFYTESYHITDINFDGNKDILVLLDRDNAKANHVYAAYLWDETNNQFEEIVLPFFNLAIDRESERLLSVVANWAASHTYEMYGFINDELQLLSSLTIEGIAPDKYEEYGIPEESDKNYWLFEEYEITSGEALLVNQFVSYSGDENYDTIINLYYTDDSKWQLGGLRFYLSDYGSGLGYRDADGNDVDVHLDLGYDLEIEKEALKNVMLYLGDLLIEKDEDANYVQGTTDYNSDEPISFYYKPTGFAIQDMDNNGVPEIILDYGVHGLEVLNYENGIIYGYEYPHRGMGAIKIDGSFIFSGGAAYNGFGKVIFNDGVSKIINMCYSTPGEEVDGEVSVEYYFHDKKISQEAFYEYADKHRYKIDVVWYEFTLENIVRAMETF